MLSRSFHDIELESWSQKASIYEQLFADISTQAIVPILDSLGDLEGKRHLDIACGTGHLVAAAAQRGAISQGIDFSPSMIEVARTNYPDKRFSVADATRLPHEDETFDAVTCSFGLSHMESPQAAVDEAFRVLKPGGRYAFTLWFSAERGGELHTIASSAVQAHATEVVRLPEAWTSLRFADEAVCESLVSQSCFLPPTFLSLPISWQSRNAQEVVDLVDKLSLRTAFIIQAQPEPVRARIYSQVLAEAELRRRDGVITLAWPALLTVVEKPGQGKTR